MQAGTEPPLEGPAASTFAEVAQAVVRAGAGPEVVWGEHRLATHFQPIYGVAQGRVVGHEALLRATAVDAPALRAPALFSGAGAAVARLDWTCRALHMRNFAIVDPGDRRLFLNVHPAAAMQETDGAAGFTRIAGYFGLSPRRICLEISRAYCADEGRLAEAVAAWRDRGFDIAIDDFGIGRSNLDRMARLCPDIVKIDLRRLGQSIGPERARRIMPALAELLADFGSRLAVEGIENAREALLAIEAGAAFVQGHHLGVPCAELREEELCAELLHSARRLALA